MINAATVVRFVLTALGLVVGAIGGFLIGGFSAPTDGLEALVPAFIGALVGSLLGAMAGNLLGANIARHRGWATGTRTEIGRAVLEGLGMVLGLVGGWILSSMTAYGQNVPGLMNIVALASGVLGFAAGASLANRIPAESNRGQGWDEES
jgi:uncharacterized protein YacL